jgi:hypothetical protein
MLLAHGQERIELFADLLRLTGAGSEIFTA